MKWICNLLGAACVFVGAAWALQAMAITGDKAEGVRATWIILGAVSAGFGVGFFLIAAFLVRSNTSTA